MPAVHVLDNVGGNNYRAVVHVATPIGNNAVGTSWVTCWLASLNGIAPASQLITGSGVGKISTTEANQIAGGTLMEFEFVFTHDPSHTVAQRDANIDAVALSVRTARLADLQARLNFYGYTRA